MEGTVASRACFTSFYFLARLEFFLRKKRKNLPLTPDWRGHFSGSARSGEWNPGKRDTRGSAEAAERAFRPNPDMRFVHPLENSCFLGYDEGMAYEVTATRRRPQSFENLVGQEFVAATLKNAIESGKIAHAYLFSGPRGCGKTSTARILAKALNCEKGPTATPCGECAACREITAGSSLDVIEIDGASNTSVNDIRQIKDEVMFPPNSCKYKIYIIDEVHMLSTSAFNALLKTIEEPPPYVIFIFATTELQKVPATIKSRCQQFNFRLVPVEKVKEQLAQAAAEVGIKAEDEALYWIARESTGSMRDSYTLFDQVAAFSDGEITYEKIRDKLGLVGVDRLNELFGLCVSGDSSTALLKLDEYMQNGVSIEQLITNCTDYLRNLLLIKNGITKEALLGQSADRFNKDVLEAWSSVQIERALSIFMQLYRDIRYSLSPRYEFELAVSRLCWLKDYVSPAEVKKAVDAVRPLLSSAAPARVVQVGGGHPFHNGGAEPPVNKSAPEDSESAAADFVSEASGSADSGGAVAEEEEWQDAPDGEEPPDMNAFVASLVSRESQETGADAPGLKESFSGDEKPLPAGNAPVPNKIVPHGGIDTSDAGKVRDAIIEDFSVGEVMLGSLLSLTSSWSVDGNTVKCRIASPFDKMQLLLGREKIASYLSALYGRQMGFDVSVEEKKSAVEEKLPIQVELLRDVFKGAVIGL